MNHNVVLRLGSVLVRRWRLTTACGAVLLVATSVVVMKVGSRRDVAMQAAADVALAAVRDARGADAMTWAPAELLAAEGRLRNALSAQRVEETRLWPIPDAARVSGAYAESERAARQAQVLARDRHATAVKTTAATIEEATSAVAASASLASSIHLDTDRRHVLARAQLALTEARVYEREGDLGRATVRAREAGGMAGQVRNHAAAVAGRYADAQTLARWRRWKEETIAWSRREGRAAIVIAKEAHLLTLFVRGQPAKTYKVDLGFNWIADKSRAGDGATPEGRYRIVSRIPASAFYKALLLDYPNAEDRTEFNRARRSGDLPRSAGIGGFIEIHGEGGRGRDWTKGCVALTNTDMNELYARVGVGTPVTIVGSDDFGAIAEFAAQHRDSGAARQP
ncbi:MAG: L,D-transpeptidase [Acidobacteria bacterium]|nr:L,D-transpeptidase [Acidobacteriota bacterium]